LASSSANLCSTLIICILFFPWVVVRLCDWTF
jgi:hypothetical protein